MHLMNNIIEIKEQIYAVQKWPKKAEMNAGSIVADQV